MSDKTVLVVEDDQHISKLVKYNLEKAGYRCLTSITAEGAFLILDQEAIDLLILDVMLPKMDGLEFCRLLRQDPRTKTIPLIMLTAKGEEVDRVVGLELGADDYMVKPFSPRELILRIKGFFRRQKPIENSKDVYRMGELTLDLTRHQVNVGTRPIELTPMEFKLLTLLIQRKGRVQSRDALLEDVWGISSDVTTRTVDTHIKVLRQKLGRVGKWIQTVRGIGYKMKDEE
ncbi:MAG: response regulator transcription factor [Candidatus Omnitrophica bacterium]|nr:response regulator transcription factor [Candidatus Omnitrophota bacterium]